MHMAKPTVERRAAPRAPRAGNPAETAPPPSSSRGQNAATMLVKTKLGRSLRGNFTVLATVMHFCLVYMPMPMLAQAHGSQLQ
jgi:hypothetical protein